jgi:uncharacterized protein involved in outer membrane biogenesis
VKKVAKAILIALGIILVIAAVAVLGVNLYVQSASTHARIEHGLGNGLHTQVKIGSLNFTPWYGLKLTTINGDDADAAAQGNSLQIADIGLRLRLWSLLRRDVVIKELTVDGVKVSWTQNREGKWQMPGRPSPSEATETEAPAESPAAQQPPPAPEAPLPPVTVNHARMRDASFNFYDKNGKPVAEFSRVFVQTSFPTDKLVEGSAKIGRVLIQQKFHLEDWNGHFKYTPEELSLLETHCKVDGGVATGVLDVKIAQKDSPFALDTQFSGVNLDQLLADAGVTELQASGQLSGFIHLRGDSRNSDQAQGNGQIVLANGFITKSDLSENLDQLLHTDKFRGFTLEDAHADFHVGGGIVTLDDLVLKCSGLTFTSQGTMILQGSALALQCRLVIRGDFAREIPDFLMDDFAKDDATGDRTLDFPITGDINHPKSTISKILARNINLKKVEKGVGNYLKKWMSGGKKAEPTPEITPAPVQPVAPNP